MNPITLLLVVIFAALGSLAWVAHWPVVAIGFGILAVLTACR